METEKSPQSTFKRSKRDTEKPSEVPIPSLSLDENSPSDQQAALNKVADSSNNQEMAEVITLDELNLDKKLLREEYKHKIEQISKFYIKIYDIFFGYGVTIIVFLVAVVLAFLVTKVAAGTSFPRRNDQIVRQEDGIIRKLNLTNQDLAAKNDMKIIVEQ